MDKIKCVYCGKEFEISEALKQHIKGEEIEKIKKELEVEVTKYKERAVKAEENEIRLRKEKEGFAEDKRKFEVEKQRQIDKERESIRQKAISEQSEIDKYKFTEYEKKIADMQDLVEEMKKKGNQGSQELQGEVGELDLEETLRNLFPTDEISEVKKGELGGDVRQIVKTPIGNECGMILWERKRTKVWQEDWIKKLKEDMRRDKAILGAIVTEVFPKDFKKEIGERNGVWIVSSGFVDILAKFLRQNLYDVAKSRAIILNKQGKADELYDFVTGHDFIQQVERMVEIYLDMKSQITKERVLSEKLWKQREMQVDGLLKGISGVYGGMQLIAGTALPQVKSLEAPEEER